MFTNSALEGVVELPAFKTDYAAVKQSLAEERLKQGWLFDLPTIRRLGYFVEAVLASAPKWDTKRRVDLCRTAAEIAELLVEAENAPKEARDRMRLRASLLYELAEMPAVAGSLAAGNGMPRPLRDFFTRSGRFHSLKDWTDRVEIAPEGQGTGPLVLSALGEDVAALARYEHHESTIRPLLLASQLRSLAASVSLGCSASDLAAFEAVVAHRASLATRESIENEQLFEQLRVIDFPPELWSAQKEALDGGLLDARYDSWGLSAPTGTGKTFLTRLLLLHTIQRAPGSQIIYLVPSRALVYEVSSRLQSAFQPLAIDVVAVTPQLVDLEGDEDERVRGAAVVVLTPEKADLLARLGPDLFRRASLIVVDEAHHIENGTRGALLEFYLWRIKRLTSGGPRFVFLSAVAPNIRELVSWIGESSEAVTSDRRSTRMRVGVYRLEGKGKRRIGIIDYTDGTTIKVVAPEASNAAREGIVQLAAAMATAGPVLVVAKGKGECETLAELASEWLGARGLRGALGPEESESAMIQRLDSRLEREMYADVPLRTLVRNRIAYHHAGLPPRVRVSVEDAIRARMVDYVFATTTLAEGVNFPFSTVIVQSLALRSAPAPGRPPRYQPVTPRSFWNIAGRAGRPGADKEGQVILFSPTLGLERINAVLGDYLNADMKATVPVQSALAASLREVARQLRSGEISQQALRELRLSKELSAEVVGALNLIRVGLVHGRASRLVESPEDILEGTFAEACLTAQEREDARSIVSVQGAVVEEFFRDPSSPTPQIVAELGLSLETLAELRDYVKAAESWQLESMHNVVLGGAINFKRVEYVVRPLASRMAELEGNKLGGFLGDIIVQWLQGVPFTVIRARTGETQSRRLEDLISVVYSRIQFLLPWGLYAMDRLVDEECRDRGLEYGGQIHSLAYLSDAGVPNLDALRLVTLDFERVDATRLAAEFRRQGGARSKQTDVVGWLARSRVSDLARVLKGPDGRRLDFDFESLLTLVRDEASRVRSI